MMSYEMERFIEDFESLKQRFQEMAQKCEIYEAALEAPDTWAVPSVETLDGSFQYIPYQLEGLAEIIIDLSKVLSDDPDFKHSRQPIRPMSFVEIGCGLARNLNIMRHQTMLPFSKTVGFDIVPEYIDAARVLYGLDEDVFVHDAMTFDYGGFDLLLFYRPFSDDKLEARFEEYLMDSVKPGAVIIGLNVERMEKSRKVAAIGTSGALYKKL